MYNLLVLKGLFCFITCVVFIVTCKGLTNDGIASRTLPVLLQTHNPELKTQNPKTQNPKLQGSGATGLQRPIGHFRGFALYVRARNDFLLY